MTKNQLTKIKMMVTLKQNFDTEALNLQWDEKTYSVIKAKTIKIMKCNFRFCTLEIKFSKYSSIIYDNSVTYT